MYVKGLTLAYDKMSKGEVFPAHTMKAHMGSSSILPIILNLATIWKQVVAFHNPAPLPSQERTSRRLGGLWSWSGHFAEGGNLFTLPAMKPKIAQTTD